LKTVEICGEKGGQKWHLWGLRAKSERWTNFYHKSGCGFCFKKRYL